MNLIFRYMKPHFPRMVVGFMVKFSGTVMDLLLPWILAYIIDEVVPEADIARVVQWGLVMVVCAFIAVLGNVTANRMASSVARDSMRVLRNDTMTLDPVLSAILASTLPFLAIVVIYVAKKGIPLYNTHQKASDVMIGRVRESITGIRVIKALSKGDYERERFENINLDVVEKEKKAGITMALTNPVMNFLLNVGWVMIIFVGAVRVNAGLTAPGKIIAFLTYFTIILNAMLSITRLFVMFSRAGSSAERIEEILQARSDIKNQDANDNKSCDESLPYIVFDNVSFSYNGNVDNLSDISFSLEKGQKLGIIGATGSGKTTIINLLMRFYDVSSGKIFIDGKDIRDYDVGVLREKFGAVFQNDIIFEDSVSENIKLGRNITDENMKKAAKASCIDSHISQMDEGYNSFLAIRGNNLSGGQKQRMLISRAIAGNPEILVLDDSSSALDYKTDAAIRKNIDEMGKNTTTIIVAQRVSSVLDCDKIIVIDEGRIAACGNHDKLLKTCAIYARISSLQSGITQ